MSVDITGKDMTVEAVLAIARDGRHAVLSAGARRAVESCHDFLRSLMEKGHPIYGVTTGFGALAGSGVSAEDNVAAQRNILRSHAAGVGEPMSVEAVRAMMALRANVLATGMVGVRPVTLDALIAMLNAGVVPYVPERGSVGACGDLAPLSHMALPLIPDGRAFYEGELLPGVVAMRRAGIEPPGVADRDGLALNNGTEQTTAVACLAVTDTGRLLAAAEAAAAMALEALGAVSDSFDERVALAKPHPGQVETSRRLRDLTRDSELVLPPGPGHLRDALSLRCIPQVIGAARDTWTMAKRTLELEINAANDNPIFDVSGGWVTSNSGNFHGQRVGEVCDFLATSLTSVAVISERRSAKLLDDHHNNGLPKFLVHPKAKPGVNNGFMIPQYTAASLIAELRKRAAPATIQSVSVGLDTEDHVPMAPIAAHHLAWVVDTVETVVAIELLLACQALDLRDRKPGPRVGTLRDIIRDRVPVMVEDRIIAGDIAAVKELVQRGDVA
ncbi:MAG: aromatic amino acid ammonia-lyase [Arenicellales bacterium]